MSDKEKFYAEWEPRSLAGPGGLLPLHILTHFVSLFSGGLKGVYRRMRTFTLLSLILTLLFCKDVSSQEITHFQVAPFGTIKIYRGAAQPSRVILLASGEMGWNGEAEALAR